MMLLRDISIFYAIFFKVSMSLSLFASRYSPKKDALAHRRFYGAAAG